MWVLALHSTHTVPVTPAEVDDWLKELGNQESELRAQAHSPSAPFRFGSAQLLLRSIRRNLEGAHWRDIHPLERLLTARNTGGRLFIVRRGLFGAYHPQAEVAEPPPLRSRRAFDGDIELTRGPNEVAGELEVFDEQGPSDRLYMLSLSALPYEARSPSRALVIPAATVSRLLHDPQSLGNPLLQELRSKTLEAELGVRRAVVRRSKTSGNGNGNENLEFFGRWGHRTASKSLIEQVACLFELALEFDRAWGVLPSHDRKLVIFANFHGARTRQFGTDSGNNYSAQTNAAVQFLEACGVVRPLCLSSHLASRDISRDNHGQEKAKVATKGQPTQRELTEHYDAVKREALQAAESLQLRDKLERIRPKSYVNFSANILESHTYVAALVESEVLLRRFAMDMTPELLDEARFGREFFAHARPTTFSPWDGKLARATMELMDRRIASGLGHLDSIGMALLTERQR
jgi:CRP-like cAMP-binding protein